VPALAPAADGEQEDLTPHVAAMVLRLSGLHESLTSKRNEVENHLKEIQEIEQMAAAGEYDLAIPIQEEVENHEESILSIINSFNIVKDLIAELEAEIIEEGITPATLSPHPSEPLDELLTPSLRRRLLRKLVKKDQQQQ
jgi:division protein CdvB (Snf7/Vps24/ESCRT-III family)